MATGLRLHFPDVAAVIEYQGLEVLARNRAWLPTKGIEPRMIELPRVNRS